MKGLLTILALLAAASALGTDDVTLKLNHVSPKGTHTNMWFECSVTIHNGTSAPLTVNNLFLGPPSLALKISDLNGKELKRLYSVGHIAEPLQWDIAPGDNTSASIDVPDVAVLLPKPGDVICGFKRAASACGLDDFV